MAAGPLAFKETDVARALRAASKAGPDFYLRIEKATGDLIILQGPPPAVQGAPAPPAPGSDDDLDDELEQWKAQRRA